MMPATASILDQETDEVIPYDPDRVAPYLQNKILDYVSRTPRNETGHNKWLVVLSSRQVGKSLCSALALYYHVAYRPATYAAIITDTKERSEDLFRAITICHDNVPEQYRAPSTQHYQSKKLTFKHHGKLRTLSAEQANVGIGRAMSFGHLSELPFMHDAADMWNGLYPAITNRKNAALIMESTPAKMTEPSAAWYQDMCSSARQGTGRFEFLFAPFYSSLLNERIWHKTWKLDSEEQNLLNRFGPQHGEPVSAPGQWRYLTLENLAFRRATMNDDAEVRRYPDLFKIFFPTDPISCWQQVGGAAIPMHALQRHLDGILIPWMPTDGYQEYQGPKEGAVYVIGADPAGWMGGDQAAFQVLELWGDEWIQVAEFSSNTTKPMDFARVLCETAERYNNALVIVESNGVGAGTLSYLEQANDVEGTVMRDAMGKERRYHVKNLYYHKLAGRADTRPGINSSTRTNKDGMAKLIDALMDRLVIRSETLVTQLQTYGLDKEVAASEKYGILNPGKKQRGRRDRHHWDRVSALIWAVYAAETLPIRYRPKTNAQREEAYEAATQRIKDGLTYNERQALKVKRDKEKRIQERKAGKRGTYRSVRKRR